MKALLTLAVMATASLAFAQDPCTTAPAAAPRAPKQLRTTVTPLAEPAPRATVQESRAPVAPAPSLAPLPRRDSSPATQEELDFLANGPRLFPMDKAQELARATGKPVFCWMGKHLFADERARALSTALADTTIQAVMDSDGEEGKVDPKTGKAVPYFRVKFSSSNYAPTAQTAYVPLEKMDKPGVAEKALAFARGGK